MSILPTKLFGTEATTRPDHEDRTLRGRRYAIPFEKVWSHAAALVAARAPGWALEEADDEAGHLRAEATVPVLRLVAGVEIRIGLDADAQTWVAMSSRVRGGRRDLGTNARRIRRFMRDLDRSLGAGPGVILPPEGAAGPSRSVETVGPADGS